MIRIVTIVVYVAFCVMSAGCVQVVGYEGDYKGRVIDAETGQPISGVVVLGVWWSKMPTPAGSTSHFHDARETVTDEKGNFTLSGRGIRILSSVEPANISIYKAGYAYMELGSWESLTYSKILREKIKWEGERAIIPLRKMTMQERRKEGTPSRPSIPDEKMQLLTKEVNKDRVERGLPPL
jgi:hypothetical protein